MINEISKNELIKKFVDNSLTQFLLSKGYVKKGDNHRWGELLGITIDDIKTYFEDNEYPGLLKGCYDKPRRSPIGAHEGDTLWTFDEGTYTVWYVERGFPTPEFVSQSKNEFEKYWKKSTLQLYEMNLSSRIIV